LPRSNIKDRPVQPPVGTVYLTVAQLRQRYGSVSHMWVERKLKSDPDFPRPVTFGSSFRFFRFDEIEAYERLCATKAIRGKGEAA
jgi:hypothetical protein